MDGTMSVRQGGLNITGLEINKLFQLLFDMVQNGCYNNNNNVTW